MEPRGLDIYLPSLVLKKRYLMANYACNTCVYFIKLFAILLSTNLSGMQSTLYTPNNFLKCWMFIAQ